MNPGDKLYGFCNGYFGRDSYDDKVVLASGEHLGTLWIVAVNAEGHVMLAQDMHAADVERWMVEEVSEWE